jgi:hypothetical protein
MARLSDLFRGQSVSICRYRGVTARTNYGIKSCIFAACWYKKVGLVGRAVSLVVRRIRRLEIGSAGLSWRREIGSPQEASSGHGERA